ncbi:H+/Cl- antiporter ClcA [Kitasatospora gansuensis]|uniref:H+/Cl- antiporter ClcA n=1 Tax=Kitasatospora gansuensis TaxID=258050 RepID=A0A7W7SBE1_9ACTN|nr:ion channel protein [Kitasatospora gansuensis]MBB4946972.1 H+/Cl- antiporter ClcA [Kitasatospora gansuensis]
MADATPQDTAEPGDLTSGPPTPATRLIPLIAPAILTGIGASLTLIAISSVAGRLENLLWEIIPDGLDIDGFNPWWILLILTVTGVAVGLTVWQAPGHAGPDPATTGLVDPPVSPYVLPGLIVATVLALAGGVSLGPENPITMINIALAYWIGRRFLPSTGPVLWVGLAAAGTIGALFGTPLAAALILSEMPGPGALWDRLFAPLISAVTGSVTTLLLVGNDFVIKVPGYPGTRTVDLFWALLVGAVGATIGLAAVYLFPLVYRAFQQIPHPVTMLTVGGLTLGALGALGGELTLFKGLDQVKELALDYSHYGFWQLLGMAVLKLVALVIASCAGFRGGRIFPAVFAAAALGFAVSALIPSVPPALSVSCAVLGVLLAVTRQGWLSLFTAAVIVPDLTLLPLLCVAALPAWLIVTGRPEMLIERAEPEAAPA